MPKIPTPPQDDTLPADNSAASPAGQPSATDNGTAFDADHAARTAQVNEGSVKNAQASWLDGMNTLLYHPDTGYLNQRGAPAVGSYGSLQDAMGKLYQQTVDNLGDDNQRGMFGRVSAPMLDAFQAQIRRHAEMQSQIYDRDASLARSAAAGNLAVNAYDTAPGADNSLYRRCLATVHNELENWFSSTHGDPAEEKNASLWEHIKQHGPDGDGGMSAIHTGIVNRLLENNQPDDARNYLDGIENSLPAPTRDKLDQFIRTGVDRQQALNAVLQAQAKSEDPAEQQKTLDGMRDSGKLGDAAYAIAQHSLQAAQQQRLAVQKQNDEQSLARVWDLKKTNPNAALTDIPASTLAYLTSRGLEKSAQAILSGHPATDDPALFNQLHRLASEDPVKFAQTSLITSSGRLSQAHMDYLQGLQDAINKQDPQAIAANAQVNDAVQIVSEEMKLTGINLNPEPGSEQEKLLAKVETGLRDRIIAAQQAKNGAPLTSDEVKNLAMGYFADQVLKSGGMLARSRDGQAADGKPGETGTPENQQGNATDGEESSAASNALVRLHAVMQTSGINLNPRKGTTQAAKFAKIEAGLRKEITDAEAQKGAPLTPDEEQNITMGYVGRVLKWNKSSSVGARKMRQQPDSTRDDSGSGEWDYWQPFGESIPPGSSSPSEYVVRKKENLFSVSQKTGVPIELLMHVNKIDDPVNQYFTSGTKIKLPEQSLSEKARDWFDEKFHKPVIDVDAATKKLQDQALPDYNRQCAHFVYNAIDEGLKAQGKKPINRPASSLAKDGGEALEKVGYRKWTSSLDGYMPKKGDVVVIGSCPGHPEGHMAMFDGEKWISDKAQTGKSGMWSNLAFRDSNASMAIYRP